MGRLRFGLACILAAALAGFGGAASAQGVGTIAHLAGTLSVKKATGAVRILSQGSTVDNGDTLYTEQDSYAEVKFIDGARVTLKPDSTVRIADVHYVPRAPRQDAFVYRLLRGGLRAVTGLIGHRNHAAYQLKTGTATIGIRGTDFTADDCVHDRSSPACKRLEPAVYVSVADGEIVIQNPKGALGLSAGQFGFAAPSRAPVFLRVNPGLELHPPAGFARGSVSLIGNGGPKFMCTVQ